MKKIILISLVLLIVGGILVYASDMTSSFVFSQENLRSAFQDISMAFNTPIVVDQTVSGKITMNLNDVTLSQAISTICKGYGLFYFDYDGVYFVGTNVSALSMKAVGYSQHVIQLNYLSASDAMSFLQPYANYITYSVSYPYLFFFGPQNVYDKALSVVKSVDMPGSNTYVVYNIYSMSKSAYRIWRKTFYSSYLTVGQFKSMNFGLINQFHSSMKFVGDGFAVASVGKTVNFKANYLPAFAMNMSVKVNSSSATQSNLTFNVSTQETSASTMQGTPSYITQSNSTVTVGNDQMAVSSLTDGNSNFIVTVSTVKSAPKASTFTLMNSKERTYNFVADYDNQNNAFKALENYGVFALGIEFQNYAFETYAGISSKITNGLQGYILIGGPIFSNSFDMNNYVGEFTFVQYPNFKSSILSSGIMTLSASLTSINNFHFKYNGNLEYRVGDFAIGGEMSYKYTQLTGNQNFNLYGSIGLVVYDGGVARVLYSPISKSFKFEMNWGG